MNAQQLQLPDGTPVEAFRCGVCGVVYAEREAYTSDRCCKCGVCGTKVDPKTRGGISWLCDTCWGPYYAKMDRERMAKAVEVQDYSGPVVHGDDYYKDIAAFLDRYDADGGTPPEFVYCCTVHAYSLDADDILENMLQNTGVAEVDESNLDGAEEFRAAVKAFNAANEKNVYWMEDDKRKVRVSLPPPKNEETR